MGRTSRAIPLPVNTGLAHISRRKVAKKHLLVRLNEQLLEYQNRLERGLSRGEGPCHHGTVHCRCRASLLARRVLQIAAASVRGLLAATRLRGSRAVVGARQHGKLSARNVPLVWLAILASTESLNTNKETIFFVLFSGRRSVMSTTTDPSSPLRHLFAGGMFAYQLTRATDNLAVHSCNWLSPLVAPVFIYPLTTHPPPAGLMLLLSPDDDRDEGDGRRSRGRSDNCLCTTNNKLFEPSVCTSMLRLRCGSRRRTTGLMYSQCFFFYAVTTPDIYLVDNIAVLYERLISTAAEALESCPQSHILW